MSPTRVLFTSTPMPSQVITQLQGRKSDTKTKQTTATVILLLFLNAHLYSNNLFYHFPARPHLRAILFCKALARVCPCNLYKRPSSALPISQAWNVGRTTEARLQQRQMAQYPLTCQHRRRMNSPSVINGIKEHLHWQWIARSRFGEYE